MRVESEMGDKSLGSHSLPGKTENGSRTQAPILRLSALSQRRTTLIVINSPTRIGARDWRLRSPLVL